MRADGAVEGATKGGMLEAMQRGSGLGDRHDVMAFEDSMDLLTAVIAEVLSAFVTVQGCCHLVIMITFTLRQFIDHFLQGKQGAVCEVLRNVGCHRLLPASLIWAGHNFTSLTKGCAMLQVRVARVTKCMATTSQNEWGALGITVLPRRMCERRCR